MRPAGGSPQRLNDPAPAHDSAGFAPSASACSTSRVRLSSTNSSPRTRRPRGPRGPRSRSLWFFQESLDLAEQSRQLRLENAPDHSVVDFGIAMDENIAEGDDAPVLADPRRGFRVRPGQLMKSLPDDLELPFHAGTEQRVVLLVHQGPARRESLQPQHG